MTWLEKIRQVRRRFRNCRDRPGEFDLTDPQARELCNSLVLMAEVIEEIARHTGLPEIDWKKPRN